MKEVKVSISIRLTNSEHLELKKIAKKNGVTMNGYMKYLINHAIHSS